jgi:glutamate-1-semialdehyde aminotransferase/spore coat polysaccharide biosynthesis protein SpsF (cytidylyltransferase family)
MSERKIAFVQARMGSSRMPGKMMMDLMGKPLLARTIDRIRRSRLVDDVVVLTTTSPIDDLIVAFGEDSQVSVFRGQEADVVGRYFDAAKHFEAEICVRLTGDCPLHDGAIVDAVLADYESDPVDYAANLFRYTWPEGTDVEIVRTEALARVVKEAKVPSHREHIGVHMARHPTRYALRNVTCPDGDYSSWHWSVDTPAEFHLIKEVYAKLPSHESFTWLDAVEVCESDANVFSGLRRHCTELNPGMIKSLMDDPVSNHRVRPASRSVGKSLAQLDRAKKVIPGASQTFSKQYTQHVVGSSPLFLERGEGARVWDLDGNVYIDYVMGLLPVILGHGHPSTVAAVSKQAAAGIAMSLPTVLESEVSELLVERIPCAEMVRFGKNGSDATAGAVRVARAFTGRDRIAVCGYHGWQDWYIGVTTRNLGIPEATRGLTGSFEYNSLESLEHLFDAHPGEIACVIMEPIGIVDPDPGFLEGVRSLCDEQGALLVFDEIITGFRTAQGGAQAHFGVTPDLATFGKGMANGLPISAVVGRKDIMSLFDEIFFSFTFGGETLSLAATKATLDVLDREDVVSHLWRQGRKLRDGYNAIARGCGLQGVTQCLGLPPHTVMTWNAPDGGDWHVLKSLFIQETAKRGLLTIGCHNVCLAHTDLIVEQTLGVYEEVLPVLGESVLRGDVDSCLEGPSVVPVFRNP